MAKLIRKSSQFCAFECYSERGILSYFLFRYLPFGENLNIFINSLSFPKNYDNPFTNQKISNPVFFSELELGKKGFGSPDGAIFFECSNQYMMMLIEGKFNETYSESCKKEKYNSTIQGQLELRWRAVSLYKNGSIKEVNGVPYLIEAEEYRGFYKDKDVFYNSERASANDFHGFRRLKLVEGVKRLFDDYISKCDLNNIYFLCITADKEPPFDSVSEHLLPRIFNHRWDSVAGHFCWKGTPEIEKCGCV